MMKLLGCTVAAIVASVGLAQNTVICQWKFNVPGGELVPISGTIVPSIGSGTLRYIGSFATAPNGDAILPMFRSGSGSADTTVFPDNTALDMSPFPAQGTADRTSGLEVAVSTAGRSNIVVSFDQRHSNRAANESSSRQYQRLTHAGLGSGQRGHGGQDRCRCCQGGPRHHHQRQRQPDAHQVRR